MTTDDAPRPGLDAAALERLREEYSPEPEPRDCLRIPCGYRGPLQLVRTDDAGWRGWCCPKCGESLRYTAPGDPDVLALLAAYDALAREAAVLRVRVASYERMEVAIEEALSRAGAEVASWHRERKERERAALAPQEGAPDGR